MMNRRANMPRPRLGIVGQAVLLAFCWGLLALAPRLSMADAGTPAPYQATGVKTGEVTATSAIIWTRLTRLPERLNDGVAPPKREANEPQLPEGISVNQLEGEVPGARGEVQVLYRARGRSGETTSTASVAVDAERDHTHQFVLTDLQPDTEYLFRVWGCEPDTSVSAGAAGSVPGAVCRELGAPLDGRFRTAPAADSPARVVFTVVTGQDYHDRDDPTGFKAYRAMLDLRPSFFVHTGDIVYYDKPAPIAQSVALARYHWHRIYSLPSNVEFHRRVPTYFIKDDHDTWQDDCWPTLQNRKMGEFTFAEGQAIFREQVPMGERTYRTVRWGKDLQVWLVEGRDFRSANTMEDGPQKTIWGQEQKDWLKRTVLESDATFKVLISPTPIVGPDRENKRDNHSNKSFTHEGDEIRRWIRDEAPDLVVVCGDRHWQYMSVHPETGVREYSCGPLSDQHAGGFSERIDAYHRYFNVVGGFLSGTVERVDGKPLLTFRHHSVDGDVLFEDQLTAQ
jgi:alkaline phosphatase D